MLLGGSPRAANIHSTLGQGSSVFWLALGLYLQTYTCDSMCMSVLERRLQILLDPVQYERLEAEARRRSLSVGATVRAAIDVFLSDDVVRRDAARRALLAIDPQPASDPDFNKDAVLADAFPD